MSVASTSSARSGETAGRSAARQSVALITGANGEVGHGLIAALSDAGRDDLVAMDLRELDAEQKARCRATLTADVRDSAALIEGLAPYDVTAIYHLAALLSTTAERTPELAHEVNVNGTMNLLRFAIEQAKRQGRPVKFIYPSTIAVYGLESIEAKARAGAVCEDEHLQPRTMYGCNKLYCEHLGRYYARFNGQMAAAAGAARSAGTAAGWLDFRCLRYPGLISADTVPSGGTSDFAPEMLHAAAQGRPYACFVREDARIPFMTMPDAVGALLRLAGADASRLTRCVYNVSAFNPSAGELAALTRAAFPEARITFEPTPARQAIVDSWPADVNCDAARRDWDFAPEHDLHKALDEYLVPRIRQRYG